ncbi:EscJ/YscJ/HrcJ family type III secretion inner membrane ring protein [Pandoraea pneumonica]|uniref:Lipoprotein n=1 Tax=Pandoraea pneumonica TaxID=2508299 RepID=A0A5E4W4A7_9BURK|nr:type III secretion inner membrane ring lipoprotein SctJ [Pandoraea pneumonica]VVE18993.1 EscJ/YscJ/HrcJ family type III secretion inner membrane ring protein [Pandoraea pneumonica]
MKRVSIRRSTAVLVLALLVSGCKEDLHRALGETEANQMLALLLISGVDADKRAETTGATVRVARSDFVRAVEVLRQHGLPREKRASVEDVFPPGQLVSSPVQEQAKLVYLKEQRLERMLAALDGVMIAEVSIAQVPVDSAGRATLPPGVAVFVKYSPEINMTKRMTDIRSLIHDSVPGVAPERISVVMQPADYRLPRSSLASDSTRDATAATTPSGASNTNRTNSPNSTNGSEPTGRRLSGRQWFSGIAATLVLIVATALGLRMRSKGKRVAQA